MSASVNRQRLAPLVIDVPLGECPLDRQRYKIYTSADLDWTPPGDDVAYLAGATTVRQADENQKPGDRLIAIIDAPKFSFAHGDDFFINRPCDPLSFEGQDVTEDRAADPEGSSFKLIVLTAHEALEAAWRGEHELELIWSAPALQRLRRVSLRIS
jgi:hypothetical protein